MVAASEAAWEAGCELLFLPKFNPDYNPIEIACTKVKGRLRPSGLSVG